MIGFAELFFAVMPVFILMGVGAAARRQEWISEAGEHTLMKLVVNVLYPSFLFWLVSQNEYLRQDGIIVTAVLTGILFVLIGYAVFYALGPLFGITESRERRAFCFTGGVYNYGYFAIPVCTPLFGAEATGVLIVVFVGVEIAMWSVGVLIVSGQLNRKIMRQMISPPVIAVIFAVIFNLLELTPYLPSFL
ncbi:MAG: AEC family transporter, partial [Puniceicoccales bacterium]